MAQRIAADRAAAAWPVLAVAAGLAVVGQLIGLYVPRAPGAAWFPGADKVQHAVAFALPVVLIPWADTLRRRSAGRSPRARVLVLLVWVSAAHAVVSELGQHAAYANRVGDPLDVLADWSGIAIGGVLAGLFLVVRQIGRGRAARPTEQVSADG